MTADHEDYRIRELLTSLCCPVYIVSSAQKGGVPDAMKSCGTVEYVYCAHYLQTGRAIF